MHFATNQCGGCHLLRVALNIQLHWNTASMSWSRTSFCRWNLIKKRRYRDGRLRFRWTKWISSCYDARETWRLMLNVTAAAGIGVRNVNSGRQPLTDAIFAWNRCGSHYGRHDARVATVDGSGRTSNAAPVGIGRNVHFQHFHHHFSAGQGEPFHCPNVGL